MSATLLDFLSETPETFVPCANCPALQRLERELRELRREVSELRCEVGYWKSRHADAVKRIEQLKEELDQSRGQTRALQDKLFGRKSEKSAQSDRSNDLFDPEEVTAAAKKRGAQPGHAGHGRRDYSHLPVKEEFVPLPEQSLACPHCGKLAKLMADTEDADVLEIDVRAHRRRIRRRRYRATCDCDPTRRTLTAPPPPKLIPKGNYGISIWTHVLLDKYSSYRPTERLLGQLEQYDLDLPAGTVNDGLKRIEPMLRPIYEALLKRNRLGGFHQADETRWLVFVLLDGKKGYGWWLWVILGADTVIYLLDSSRSHEVPEAHFGPEASERAGRGPAVARKNFYGSGSLWSGQLAAAMFSLLATLAHWKVNPRLWLTWYLESCAAADGKAPEDIQPFLPWNLSGERHAALAMRTTTPAAIDTS